MFSALTSIFTQRRVRHDVAMTGEITLRGLVLPVGGIKEKVLAAKRAGIAKVLLPERNEKDIKEIRDDAVEGLEITYLKRMEEAMDQVLEPEPVADPRQFFAVPDADRRQAAPAAAATDANGATIMEGSVIN